MHYIKNFNTKQAKATIKLGDRAKYRIGMTGTPITKNIVDFFNQFRFIDKTVFGNRIAAFRDKYCILDRWGSVTDYQNIDDYEQRISPYTYRITKEECLDLPEQIFQDIKVQLDTKTRKLYNNIKKDIEVDGLTISNILTKSLRLSQITGGHLKQDTGEIIEVGNAKLKALEEILIDRIDAGKKTVIFANFRAELNAIQQLCNKLNAKNCKIDGDTSATDRAEYVKQFQEGDTLIFIAQIKTAGIGITLTASDMAIYYSLNYEMVSYEQSLSRIHRIGQKNKCTYIHLIAENTIDETIIDCVKNKKNIAEMLLQNL
jgi:SNF2 family DNA or RNA helicase